MLLVKGDWKRLPQRRFNFIDGYISSYCYIIKSPKRLEQISQENKLASVLCDLDHDCKRRKEDKKKRSTEVEKNRRQRYEENQVRENEDWLRGLDSCEDLVVNYIPRVSHEMPNTHTI